MISYPYEELFNKDSIDKQLHITDGDSINLGNSEIYQESFELVETLCSERDLYYGACNSAILRFTTSNLSEFKGKTLTVSVVLANHTEAPFQFGVYKVYEDKFTADRTKKEIVCYDALYEVINANVVDWYNTILPDMETTVTLKQFRDSFFAQFGITQEAIALDNDDMVVERTISATTLSGSDVLKSICSVNGCFGRINRQGNFEYFYVHQTTNPIYPAITLYPSEDLYPAFDGDYDATEVGRNGTYIKCQFEDFDVMPIDKLIIRDEEGEVGYTYGNGTNAYVLQGNFLLYGKNSTELQPIAENIYNRIEGAYYRPCEIEIKGNPCFEIGDGIYIKPTNASRFVTIITNRTYSGIQAQRDIFATEGTEYRDENLNSPSEQMYQLRGYSNRINRTLEHTISELENFEEGVASEFEQTASDISAKVSKTDHNTQNTFGWTLDTTGFDVKANSVSVFKVNSTGAEIKGKITAESGFIGSSSQGFVIDSDDIHNGMTSLSDTTHNGIYLGTDGIALGKGNFKVTNAGAITAKSGNIGNFGIGAGLQYLEGGTEVCSIKPTTSGSMAGLSMSGQNIEAKATRVVDIEGANTYLTGTTAISIKTADCNFLDAQGAVRWYYDTSRIFSFVPIYAPSFNNTSDKNLKEDIKDLDEKKSVKFVLSLKPCEFRMKSDKVKHHGFIAQEIKSSMYDDWDLHKEVEGTQYLSYNELLADLVATVQNQQKQIDELKSIINKREGDLK